MGQVVANKDVDDLEKAMKQNLRYAEITVNYNDAKLYLLEWSERTAETALQASSLEAPRDGKSSNTVMALQ